MLRLMLEEVGALDIDVAAFPGETARSEIWLVGERAVVFLYSE
jgi:hypothetical protein